MQLTVRIPDEEGKKLATLAQKMALRRSDLVRLAIKRFISETDEPGEQSPFQKVRHIIGIAESGVRDLGQRHRDYLVQKLRRSHS